MPHCAVLSPGLGEKVTSCNVCGQVKSAANDDLFNQSVLVYLARRVDRADVRDARALGSVALYLRFLAETDLFNE